MRCIVDYSCPDFSPSLPLWDSPLPSPPPARSVMYLFIPQVDAGRGGEREREGWRGEEKRVTVGWYGVMRLATGGGEGGSKAAPQGSPGTAAAAQGTQVEEWPPLITERRWFQWEPNYEQRSRLSSYYKLCCNCRSSPSFATISSLLLLY